MASSTQQSWRNTSPNHVHSANPVGPDGAVRCYHNQVVDVLTSKSGRNPGREFYTCFKNRDDPDKCKFFKWADELPSSPTNSQGPPLGGPTTPRSPSKRSRDVEVTPSTPNVSPSKATANAALNRSFRSNSIAVDDVEEFPSTLSDEEVFLFLKGTPDSSDRPAKKFKFHKPDETPGAGPSGLRRSAALGPSTCGESRTTSPTKTPIQKTQWQTIKDDPENPFHARAAALSHTQPPGQAPSTPASGSVTADSITQALDTFLAVPDTVRKLERKLNAAEKSRDAKAEQIVKLGKEVQGLKDRNNALEEEIESLKARS